MVTIRARVCNTYPEEEEEEEEEEEVSIKEIYFKETNKNKKVFQAVGPNT